MTKRFIFLVTMFAICVAAFFLIHPKKEYSYNYLMSHPAALKKDVDRCLAAESKHIVDPHCMVVSNAQRDFEQAVAEERSDPQAYGKKLLAAQWELSQLAKTITQLRAGSNLDLMKLKLAQTAYRQQTIKIKIMLNIVAVTNWE